MLLNGLLVGFNRLYAPIKRLGGDNLISKAPCTKFGRNLILENYAVFCPMSPMSVTTPVAMSISSRCAGSEQA